MSSNDDQNQKRSRNAIYLRLSQEQLKQLEQVCRGDGPKPQQLLLWGLHAHLNPNLVSFDKTAAQILSSLNRIGNNVNQIARRVNAGVSRGWYHEFDQFVKEMEEMRRMLGAALGHC